MTTRPALADLQLELARGAARIQAAVGEQSAEHPRGLLVPLHEAGEKVVRADVVKPVAGGLQSRMKKLGIAGPPAD